MTVSHVRHLMNDVKTRMSIFFSQSCQFDSTILFIIMPALIGLSRFVSNCRCNFREMLFSLLMHLHLCVQIPQYKTAGIHQAFVSF